MNRLIFGCLVLTAVAGSSMTVFAARKPSPEEVFKIMDTNDDGRLARNEYVGKATGKEGEEAKAKFDKLDRDASGLLTYEEFAAGSRKSS